MQVSRLGQNYQAAYWTQGNDPATSSGPAGSGQPWLPMGACSSGPTATNTPLGPTFTPTRTNTPAGPTFTPTRTNTPGSGGNTINVQIATPDLDNFRRSESYITGQIARAVARGQRSL